MIFMVKSKRGFALGAQPETQAPLTGLVPEFHLHLAITLSYPGPAHSLRIVNGEAFQAHLDNPPWAS